MKKIFYFIVIMMAYGAYGQDKPISAEITINKFVDGSLLAPTSKEKLPLVIIIPDSGPTDRNGNQNFLKNNSLKKLAESLADNNIASFRYDKRVVKEMRKGNVNLKVSFDDFVSDASTVIDYFKKSDQFDNLYIIGHGQGSLVGMLALDENIEGFISIAGAGKSLDSTLLYQVQKTAPGLTKDTERILNILREGKTTRDYPQALDSFFDIEIQPFMSSWIKYDPRKIIQGLKLPKIIINGTKDLQVTVEESENLNESAVNSELKIIPKMNHVMFLIEGDDLENSKSYNESGRNISQELIQDIVQFIQKNQD